MRNFLLLLVIGYIFISCNEKKAHFPKANAAVNQAKSLNAYASGFSLDTSGTNTHLTVRNPWQHARGVEFNYILSDTAKTSWMIDERSWLIKTPVTRVICLSTTHIGFIELLGETGTIKGISGKTYIVNTKIRNGIDQGNIPDVGYDENLNYELILKIKPDLVFAYGVSVSITNTVKKLNELGIPVILIGEYLEEEPLAKTEWVKVFAACYAKQNVVNQKFDTIAAHYHNLVRLVQNEKLKPSILLGLPYRGSWYVSGSKSYIARLIKDAGGQYIWNHLDFNESRPMGLEKIFENALTADLWINPGEAMSIQDILSVDERFGSLPSLKNNKVYNNNNRLVKTGGNDFYEQGVVEPDIILKDLICIIHPQLLPSHRLKYYRKLP